MPLDERDRAVVLTDRGRELLEMHRRDRDDERGDRYGDRVNRRELTHDASVYDAYRHAASELRERGADVRDVVMERELKREYQDFLQARNRDRADSNGRPDRERARSSSGRASTTCRTSMSRSISRTSGSNRAARARAPPGSGTRH
jgi:hypothetical protein